MAKLPTAIQRFSRYLTIFVIIVNIPFGLTAIAQDNNGQIQEQSIESLKSACVVYSNGNACNVLGQSALKSRGIGENPYKAFSYFKRSCDLGFGPGCSNLGAAYMGGVGNPQDESNALAAFQRACDGGVKHRCDVLRQYRSTNASALQDAGEARNVREIVRLIEGSKLLQYSIDTKIRNSYRCRHTSKEYFEKYLYLVSRVPAESAEEVAKSRELTDIWVNSTTELSEFSKEVFRASKEHALENRCIER